jgi:hypothetical protein
LELNAISGLAARVVYKKASRRLQSLTEEEVIRWREGAWMIAEEVIGSYPDKLLAHSSLILSAMETIAPEDISDELSCRRPDLARYWQDDLFFRRLHEEKDAIKAFLNGSGSPTDPVD